MQTVSGYNYRYNSNYQDMQFKIAGLLYLMYSQHTNDSWVFRFVIQSSMKNCRYYILN